MLEILLFCAMILGYHCQDYGKSKCSSIYKPLDPECGEMDLQAQANTTVLTGPEFKDVQKGYLRSCVWTITAREGYSIALNVIEIDFNHEIHCWPNFLKVYSGKEFKDPQKEVFSVCSENDNRSVQTGWSQVTIVFQVYESFRGKTFELHYEEYTKESFSPPVAASLSMFPRYFINIICTAQEGVNDVNSTFTFNWDKEVIAEIFVYYCVHRGLPLTHFWLTTDSPEKASKWQSICNNTVCKIYSDDLVPPLSGHYTFSVRVGQISASVSFQVITENAPQMHTHAYATIPYLRGLSYRFDCDFLGEPVPEAYWFFYSAQRVQECVTEHLPNFSEWTRLRQETLNQSKGLQNSEDELHYVCSQSDYRLGFSLTAAKSGCLVCWTRNSFGRNHVIEAVPVSGPSGDFIIIGSKNESLEDEMFTLTCMADSFDFDNLKWSFRKEQNGLSITQNELEKRDLITIERNQTSSTIILVLRFERLTTDHEGYYTCSGDRTSLKYSRKEYRYLTEEVEKQTLSLQKELKVVSAPVFDGNSSSLRDDTVPVKISEESNQTLNCSSRGRKPIHYKWQKVHLDGSQALLIGYKEDYVVVTGLQAQEAQAYVCFVTNTAGDITRRFNIQFISITKEIRTVVQESNYIVPVALACTGTILAVLIVGTFLFLRWKRKFEENKRRTQIVFLPPRRSGPVEVNIPLDVAWEFPDQRLVLGEKIGHGAYGRVVKAQAFGICPNEDVTTVAVKMLKANANASHKKALFAELKILIHLGRNLNVVNLLGAVTKHQTLGKLMIIVEYCEKGCLLKILQQQRKKFVCQVHQDTGRLDKKLYTLPFQKNSKITHSDSDDKVTNTTWSTVSAAVSDEKTISTAVTDEMSTTSSVRTNNTYVMDETTTPESESDLNTDSSLSTTDLIKFSFQCGKGMEYIAARKLVHRDLAARNVLLTKDNIIKICDFGLTRDEVYLYNNIKKSALPIRWMAPESLGQNQFTTKSDVWSFGILLWEMFTLGDNPYAGMTIDHEFYKKIFSGYRLEPPNTTPKPVSKMMLDCWQEEPGERPSFTDIVDCFSDLLEEQERNYYLILNAPYAATNRRDSTEEDGNMSLNHEFHLESLFDAEGGLSEQIDQDPTVN